MYASRCSIASLRCLAAFKIKKVKMTSLIASVYQVPEKAVTDAVSFFKIDFTFSTWLAKYELFWFV